MDYDLKITGGEIYDGTGGPGRIGDLGIKDGVIAAIGKVDGRAQQTIDARGMVVSPGFIDTHTHYDAQVMWDRMLTISPWHGVTTVVLGNCGFGIAPTRPKDRDLMIRTLQTVEGMSLEALRTGLGDAWSFETFPQYLDAIEARGTAINVGVLIGHTPTRLYVMGEDASERHARADEIAAMRRIVSDALDAGALGFATSMSENHVGHDGRPVPSYLASVDEVYALASPLKDAGRGLTQITAGKRFFVEELGELARRTGRPVTWTSLLTKLRIAGRDPMSVLRDCQALCEQGVSVISQVTPRPFMIDFSFMAPSLAVASLPTYRPAMTQDREGRKRLFRDASFRAAFKEEAAATGRAFTLRWDQTAVAEFPGDLALEERTLGAIASERGTDPIGLAMDLALASDMDARFRMPLMNDEEDDVEILLKAPHTVLGLSDAGAHANMLCDACQATYLLGRWVREKRAIPMEKAIWMLTGRAAEVFGISDRGRIAPGLAADVVVFDADQVGAGRLRRVRDFPAGQARLVSDAAGIRSVIVNGVPIRRDNEDLCSNTDSLPGRLLRRGRAASR
ncbi:MAG: N-acyl-D-amino-acid deacylase family protein [Burkholderiales bacterium]